MLVHIVLHVHAMPVIQEFELIEINSFIHRRISYKHAGFHYISYILQLKRGVCGRMHLPDAEPAMPLSRCRRAAPQRSGGNPPPRCRQGGASAEPAMSSASLLAGRGLGGAGGVLCLVVGAAGPRRSRASSTPAEQGLVGAGILLYLVLGLAKHRLARFIPLFASLFVGGRSLRHPHAVPPALEAALAGGAV